MVRLYLLDKTKERCPKNTEVPPKTHTLEHHGCCNALLKYFKQRALDLTNIDDTRVSCYFAIDQMEECTKVNKCTTTKNTCNKVSFPWDTNLSTNYES